MGKYHPHGDSSIYDSLVVMTQDFKKGLALIEGHGNFGDIDGAQAAAYRYTEARMSKMADEMLRICRKVAPEIFCKAGPGCVCGRCPEKKPCGHPRNAGEWDE